MILLSCPSQVIKLKNDHSENSSDMLNNILLIRASLFLKKTRKPIIKATIVVGIWE
jgi:hypothetical protein